MEEQEATAVLNAVMKFTKALTSYQKGIHDGKNKDALAYLLERAVSWIILDFIDAGGK